MKMTVELVPVRNKKTGVEKRVPPRTAEAMISEDWLKKDWELIRQDTPTPYEVIKHQEEMQKTEQPVEQFATEDLSALSVRQLTDKLEYLTVAELNNLQNDERVSVRRMVDKELKRRDDGKEADSGE